MAATNPDYLGRQPSNAPQSSIARQDPDPGLSILASGAGKIDDQRFLLLNSCILYKILFRELMIGMTPYSSGAIRTSTDCCAYLGTSAFLVFHGDAGGLCGGDFAAGFALRRLTQPQAQPCRGRCDAIDADGRRPSTSPCRTSINQRIERLLRLRPAESESQNTSAAVPRWRSSERLLDLHGKAAVGNTTVLVVNNPACQARRTLVDPRATISKPRSTTDFSGLRPAMRSRRRRAASAPIS